MKKVSVLKSVTAPRKKRERSPQAKAIRAELYRRRFLLPNLVTLGNLFCGFLAIIYSSSERYDKAAVAIGVAILLDGLDGRVARRFNATSPFGLEFDSFSDLVSFGLAPAMLVYHWCFQSLANDFGIFVCFMYALCAASRLARFNIQAANLSKFNGLPTPGAAGVVAAAAHLLPVTQESYVSVVVASVITVALGALMVSTFEFFSIKSLKFRTAQIRLKVLLGLFIGLLWYNDQIGFVLLASCYALSGPVIYLMNKRKIKPISPIS